MSGRTNASSWDAGKESWEIEGGGGDEVDSMTFCGVSLIT